VTRAPRWLLVVRRDQPRLYAHLREAFAGVEVVEVILDRRGTETSPASPERRRLLTKEEEQLWIAAGFRLVHRDRDFTILRTDEAPNQPEESEGHA
jgi:hypothetical protein